MSLALRLISGIAVLLRSNLVESEAECRSYPSGRSSHAQPADINEQLLGMLARESARMVVDLSGLEFLDCAGAGALVAVSRRAMLLGGTLAIAAPRAPVARLLQLTGLDQHFAVFPSSPPALAAVRQVSLLPVLGVKPAPPGHAHVVPAAGPA